MLPDWFDQKRKYRKRLDELLSLLLRRHLSPVKNVPQYQLFEGNKSVIVRPNGEVEETKMGKSSAGSEYRDEDVCEMTLDRVIKDLDGIAQNLAHQQLSAFYGTLSQTCEKTGNIINAENSPLTPDVLLDVLESFPIDFDESGNPINIELHTSEEVSKQLDNYMKDPSVRCKYEKRHKELIQKKKSEWNAREAGRKLVG